ncbi:GNAT family N-acetyltransferase [Oceanicoccus sp. KOV_DT_Chl]|uniref:GNAT family N-acetyltransferase n=1 Tax=Oceanicoccus sp. KOV_DT_Chl TaxID=1904639 RepID=UPI000C7A1A50|nr:GNAT family N-acetyltransferase [Oceanicoccus sp. KOV_DT_Chl]
MKNIEYIEFEDINCLELIDILNQEKVREHLVSHEIFDEVLLEEWVKGKVQVNLQRGCRVKGIKLDGAVAGWCGIQFENGSYELAIVLGAKYWGLGISVFRDVMRWASELGHTEVVLHLFNTRPEYRFLKKIASRVYESKMFGQRYISYELRVPSS